MAEEGTTRLGTRHSACAAAVVCVLAACVAGARGQPIGDRVIVVTLDGFRWQEMFGGADRELILGRDGGVSDTTVTLSRFHRPTLDAPRRTLMPFVWTVIAANGAIFGDSTEGSVMLVTNGKRFSYPGYNELFTGAADARIDSNDKLPNPNVTVLEWLAAQPGFRGRIEVFGSWDVFPYIFNVARSRLAVNGDGLPFPTPRAQVETALNEMTTWLPTLWQGARLDAPTMAAALHALRVRRPKVLAVLLGETDEWAHGRRYDLYLDAAQRSDHFIEQLWRTAQSLPEYAGRTSLIISTDHGRGASSRDWTDHGREVPAADRIWMAVLGPNRLGEATPRMLAGTQSQFAATIAALVGENWQSARPEAAPPLPGIASIRSR